MSDVSKPSPLYWLVAVLAVMFGIGLVYDWWMLNAAPPHDAYAQEMIAWIRSFPIWRQLVWGVSVVTGAVGGITLLLRRRWAVTLYMISFVTLLGGFIGHDLLLADGVEKYGSGGLIASTVLILLTGLFWAYARQARGKGWL
ncbi:MAG: hypothetical protein V3V30_04780 [Parvularculaceae bacterium]